jgi:hypothetical protein
MANCTMSGRKGTILPPPSGWDFLRTKAGGMVVTKGQPEGVMYAQIGVDGRPVASPQSLDQIQRDREKAAKISADNRKRAGELWAQAEPWPQDRLARYIRFRGIDVNRLPAPPRLRYAPRCLRMTDGSKKTYGPAMLAVIAGEKTVDGKPQAVGLGVHRTYLALGGDGKADGSDAKKILGQAKGGMIRLLDPAATERPETLIIAEGIETALACAVATGAAAWASVSAAGMSGGEIPASILVPLGTVSRVIIAADTNAFGRGKKAGVGVGVDSALVLASRTRGAHPGVTVTVRPPGLVEASALTVRPPGSLWPVPAPGRDGADWLDVLNAEGPAAVSRGLLGDVGGDHPAGRSDQGPVAGTGGTDETVVSSGGEGTPVESMGDDDRCPVDDGGDSGGDDSGGGPPGGAPWRPLKPEDMPLLVEGDLNRARRYLWDRQRVAGASRFGLARYAGRWWRFDGAAYAEVDDDALRSGVLDWLNGFSRIRTVGKTAKLARVDPTPRMAQSVVDSLVTDTFVDSDAMPVWLSPIFDRDGMPTWAKAVGVDRGAGPARPCTHLVFPSGRLDLTRLCDETRTPADRVALEPNSPDLFTTTCLPFDLPMEELEDLVRGRDRGEIYSRLCPKFWGWMADASGADPAWERQLMLMLGDTVSGNRALEKVFAVVGVQRGGKGIIEDALAAIMGEANIEALDSQTLSDRFGLAHLIGKPCAVMPDAHIDGAMGENSIVVERLKAISGRGRLPVRDMYQRSKTVRLATRVWIFSNAEPNLKDHSSALAGRFVWLPIVKSYLGREDPSIKAAVPEEAAGIMLLALEGAMALHRRREIPMCGHGQQIAAEFQERSAPLQAFLTDYLVRADTSEYNDADLLTSEEIYRLYAHHAEQELGREPMRPPHFWAAVKWPMGGSLDWIQPRIGGRRDRRLPGWTVTEMGGRVLDGMAKPSTMPDQGVWYNP